MAKSRYTKLILLIISAYLVIIAGIFAGFVYLADRQDKQEKAAIEQKKRDHIAELARLTSKAELGTATLTYGTLNSALQEKGQFSPLRGASNYRGFEWRDGTVVATFWGLAGC